MAIMYHKGHKEHEGALSNTLFVLFVSFVVIMQGQRSLSPLIAQSAPTGTP
jgi:hypothetical protein